MHQEPFVTIDIGDLATDGGRIHERWIIDPDPIGVVVFFSVAIARGCFECLERSGLD